MTEKYEKIDSENIAHWINDYTYNRAEIKQSIDDINNILGIDDKKLDMLLKSTKYIGGNVIDVKNDLKKQLDDLNDILSMFDESVVIGAIK